MTGNAKQFAAYAGVSEARVSQWRKNGLLVFAGDGRTIEFEASDRRIYEATDPAYAGRRKGRSEEEGYEPSKPDSEKDAANYLSHKTRLEKEKADKAELENQVRRKQLIEVSVVVQLLDRIAEVVNSNHEQVCARLPDEFTTMTDARQIRVRLRDELHAGANTLADAVRQFETARQPD